MAASSPRTPSREKVREHRARLRAQGLRPIQIWVPDVRSPAFRAEAHRQSLIAANSPRAAEDQAFIDSVSVWGSDDLLPEWNDSGSGR
jgi:hypothetical protein